MFGYLKPFKPDLRICEYDAYKAVYCGLCGQLGKSFGPAARLTLSYDFAFLAMLGYAVGTDAPVIEKRRCYFNPLLKLPICLPGEQLSLGADTALIMLYYKLIDNMRDGGLAQRALCGMGRPFAARAHRKAAGRRPGFETAIANAMSSQQLLEANRTASIDAACEPTALAMQAILSQLCDGPGQKRALERVGYLIGRYVYLCDALDDLEKDLKSGGYNPFIFRYKLDKDAGASDLGAVFSQGRDAVYLTAGEAGKAYQLLEADFFGPILDNVFYQGLRAGADDILKKRSPKLVEQLEGPVKESCPRCAHSTASNREKAGEDAEGKG